MKLLLVEDEDAIAEPLAEGLRREGFAVERVATGQAALDATEPDLVLLDVGLRTWTDSRSAGSSAAGRASRSSWSPPRARRSTGSSASRSGRTTTSSSRSAFASSSRGSAPSPGGRASARHAQAVKVGPLELDTRSRRVSVDGVEIELTPKEFDLLALLASDPGRRRLAAAHLRGRLADDVVGSAKTIDVHVAALRKKLGHPSWIETVRGIGLRLNVPT